MKLILLVRYFLYIQLLIFNALDLFIFLIKVFNLPSNE